MAVVPQDTQLAELEDAEAQLDLEIAKQEKLAAIAEKQRRLAELQAQTAGGAPGGGTFTSNTVATLTVKKGTYQDHSEHHSSSKSSGISIGLGKDAQLGHQSNKGNTAEIHWTKNQEVEGSLPVDINNSAENTGAFLAVMGVTTEQLLALKDK